MESDRLDWLVELRAHLQVCEVKHRVLVSERARLMVNPGLLERMYLGLCRATVVIVDPQPVATAITLRNWSEGMVDGHGYELADVIRECAKVVIRRSPLARATRALQLPSDQGSAPVGRGVRLTADEIQSMIGSTGLRPACAFAVRSGAAFDVPSNRDKAMDLERVLASPQSVGLLNEVVSTPRWFDRETPGVLAAINRVGRVVAARLPPNLVHASASGAPLAQEEDSRQSDHLQAADLAAGHARELLDGGLSPADLGSLFSAVWYNGTRV
jgi:hypothetical protein